MKRSGWSLPAGPAMTPQAASGWSARACATILSWSALLRESMRSSLAEGLNQALLDVAEPGVDLERGGPRVERVELAPLVLELLGHPEPDAEGDADVVQGPQPGLGLLAGQLHRAAVGRQRVQHGLRDLLLGRPQRLLGVAAELTRRVRVVAVGVGQQAGQRRVERRPGPRAEAHHRVQLGRRGNVVDAGVEDLVGVTGTGVPARDDLPRLFLGRIGAALVSVVEQ